MPLPLRVNTVSLVIEGTYQTLTVKDKTHLAKMADKCT